MTPKQPDLFADLPPSSPDREFIDRQLAEFERDFPIPFIASIPF